MEIKILIPCFFLFVLASGQSGQHKSYDWRTTGRIQEWPKLTSLSPYDHQADTETHPAAPNRPGPYRGGPSAYHHSSGAYPEGAYSSEYHGPAPYQYPGHGDVDQSISSYEQPYDSAPQEEIDMTKARIGGFAGSGDTRGFGAYDFPRSNHHEETRQGGPQLQKELTDLLKISRNHHTGFHNPDSMLVHPMPPPL